MDYRKYCDIALLRPADTAMEVLLAHDAPDAELNSRLHQILLRIEEILDEAAKRVQKVIRITKYQLYEEDGIPMLLSRKRSQEVRSRDLLCVLDPSATYLSYVQGVIDTQPLQRGLIAFTSSQSQEDLFRLMALNRVPLVSPSGPQYVPRVFSLHLPLNADLEAELMQQNIRAASLALQYPEVPPRALRGDDSSFIVVGSDDREAQPSFRQYLVEEGRDREQ